MSRLSTCWPGITNIEAQWCHAKKKTPYHHLVITRKASHFCCNKKWKHVVIMRKHLDIMKKHHVITKKNPSHYYEKTSCIVLLQPCVITRKHLVVMRKESCYYEKTSCYNKILKHLVIKRKHVAMRKHLAVTKKPPYYYKKISCYYKTTSRYYKKSISLWWEKHLVVCLFVFFPEKHLVITKKSILLFWDKGLVIMRNDKWYSWQMVQVEFYFMLVLNHKRF